MNQILRDTGRTPAGFVPASAPTTDSDALLPDMVRGMPAPRAPGSWVVLTVWALLAFLLAWACLARLDVTVEATGAVTSRDEALPLQPLERAAVRAVHVRAGEAVRAGQVLVELDPEQTRASLQRAEALLDSLEAEAARVGAELGGHAMPSGAGAAWAAQAAQLRDGQAERAAQRQTLDLRRRNAEAQALAAGRQIALLEQRVRGQERVLEQQEALFARGLATLANRQAALREVLQARQEIADQQRRQGEAENEIASISNDVARTDASRRLALHERGQEVERRLHDARRDLQEAALRARDNHLRAPFDATVLEVGERGAGSVAGGGEVLIRLTRVDVPIEVAVEVPARDSAWVRAGLPARIEFVGLPSQRHGAMRGEVRAISPNTTHREGGAGSRGATPAHRAWVSVEPGRGSRLRNLPPGFRPSPGTPVTVAMTVGERAPIWLFLDPIRTATRGSLGGP